MSISCKLSCAWQEAKNASPAGERYADISLGVWLNESAYDPPRRNVDAQEDMNGDQDQKEDAEQLGEVLDSAMDLTLSTPIAEDEDASQEADEPVPIFASVEGVGLSPAHPTTLAVEDLPILTTAVPFLFVPLVHRGRDDDERPPQHRVHGVGRDKIRRGVAGRWRETW